MAASSELQVLRGRRKGNDKNVNVNDYRSGAAHQSQLSPPDLNYKASQAGAQIEAPARYLLTNLRRR